ncbi:endothelial cell-specific chemotaxis regulator isoform X2 [Amblyraja radiata]|uniref:endothelial cell-specific chemotaxis regulator isoform X2 n=1 Tax=Amblyraja radiata TaxID=386614 RepID=UPI0014032005|nr:endothelial cell-specific chemotaxis regulator isoform X2 [Amblyraja radiata]
MKSFKVIVFLFFSLYLKGATNNATTTVATNHSVSSLTSGKPISGGVTTIQTTTEVSNSSSATNTSTITTSAGSENFTSEVTISDRTETTVNTSTGDNSTSFPVTSNGLYSTIYSMYSTTTTSSSKESLGPTPTPTTSGTSSLSVLAFAVIILILILVIVVVILVSVISLRFKCGDCQEAPQDTSKTRNEAPSESSQVNGEKESITLVSMRSLYTEAGGQESSMQGNLQNDSNEVDETRNNVIK